MRRIKKEFQKNEFPGKTNHQFLKKLSNNFKIFCFEVNRKTKIILVYQNSHILNNQPSNMWVVKKKLIYLFKIILHFFFSRIWNGIICKKNFFKIIKRLCHIKYDFGFGSFFWIACCWVFWFANELTRMLTNSILVVSCKNISRILFFFLCGATTTNKFILIKFTKYPNKKNLKSKLSGAAPQYHPGFFKDFYWQNILSTQARDSFYWQIICIIFQ